MDKSSSSNDLGFCSDCAFNPKIFGRVTCNERLSYIVSAHKSTFKQAFEAVTIAEPENCLKVGGVKLPGLFQSSSEGDPNKIVCCTCPDAPHCASRRQAMTSPPGPPHPDFAGKIWYFTMGSASYVWALEHFISGLVDMGVDEESIGIVCIDKECTSHFESKNIRVEFFGVDYIEGTACQANHKVSNTRCKVSMGKADITLKVLRQGDAIFFFDADVLFFQHPYKAMKVRNPNLPFYGQTEGGAKVNFGIYLAYPDSFSISLFEYIRVVFDLTQLFDQTILNAYLLKETASIGNTTDCLGTCGRPYDYESLPKNSYMNVMTGRYREDMREEHVVSHATCVEGGILPQIAMKTLFGSPSRKYYHEQKTVTLDETFGNTALDAKRIDRSMRALVYVAKHTGRAIRLTSKVTSRMTYRFNWFRLISSNYIIGELNISLVEDRYYDRAIGWFNRTLPMKRNISISTDSKKAVEQLEHLATNVQETSEIDEMVFHVSELAVLDGDAVGRLAGEELGYQSGKWIRPFTCALIEKDISGCLQVCDGNAAF